MTQARKNAELLEASFDDSLPRVKRALAAGAELEARDEGGRTAFHIAALNGRMDVMRFLATRGADVDAPDRDGISALFAFVAFDCELAPIRFLLDRGAAVDLANVDGWTPLMAACTWDERWNDVVRLLLKRGADKDHRSKDGWTPLVLACAQACWVTRGPEKILLDAGANVNRASAGAGWTPLMMAVRLARIEVVGALLDRGASVNAMMRVTDTRLLRPRTELARRYHRQVKPATIGAGFTPLLWAAKDGKLDVVKLLGEAGANFGAVSKAGDTVTSLAKGTRVKQFLAKRMTAPRPRST